MIKVKEATTKKDFRKFVDFPNKLYKNNPYFVPAMYADDLDDLNPNINPAFEYCSAKCFLAYKDGDIVGRIAVIHNRAANEKWSTNAVRFSQVDFLDDFEISSALFKAAEDYARSLDCTEIIGPMGFCDLDREGMLIDGFDQRSMFYTYYNAPYYPEHLERLGYVKNFDWVEFMITIPDAQSETSTKIGRLAELVSRKHNLRIPELKGSNGFIKYLDDIFRLLNVCYSHLDGTVPLTDKQIVRYTKKYISIIDPRFSCLVLDSNDRLVAFGITAPSIDLALKKSHGRLFPFGAFRVLRALRKNDVLDMFLVAVTPELQGSGVNAMLINHILKSAQKMGIKHGETGPQLMHNKQVQSQWKYFDLTHHKTRRCFIKQLTN